MQVIGISGKPRAGKDTIADVLVKHFDYKKISFATPLKEITSEVFRLPAERLGDDKDRPFEKPLVITNTHVCHLLDMLGCDDVNEEELIDKFAGRECESPRQLLQFVGTDFVRKEIDNDLWIKLFNIEVKKHKNVVCPDARMPNEREMLRKEYGAELILVERPNFGIDSDHVAENSLGEVADYDVHVTNDGTLTKLQHGIKVWYEYIREKRVRDTKFQQDVKARQQDKIGTRIS